MDSRRLGECPIDRTRRMEDGRARHRTRQAEAEVRILALL